MKYWFSFVLILMALVLGGFGLLFGQFGLDVAALFVALLAIGIFLWSSLHLSLRLRSPSQRQHSMRSSRSDEKQAALLGDVIFKSRDDSDGD